MSNDVKKTGSVKFFNESKGFGFIIDDESDSDIFVHATGCKAGVRLKENDRVSYEIEDGKRGLNAANVEKV